MTVSADFLRWNAFREDEEGGWANVRGDRGGQTRFGITKALLDRLHAQGRYLHVDFDTMTREQASEIGYTEFWVPVRGDELGWPLSLTVADFEFTSGFYSSSALQRLVGANRDGEIGSRTLELVAAKIAEIGNQALANAHCEARERFLADIHQAGSIVRGDHAIGEETKFLEGLWVRTGRVRFLVGKG